MLSPIDKKKMIAKQEFLKLSFDEQKEVTVIYGDNLLAWYDDQWIKKEQALKDKEARLRGLGVNVDKMKSDIFKYLDKRFGK